MKKPVSVKRVHFWIALSTLTLVMVSYGQWWFIGVLVWFYYNIKRLEKRND